MKSSERGDSALVQLQAVFQSSYILSVKLGKDILCKETEFF